MASEKIQNILEEIKALSLLEANELKNAICEELRHKKDLGLHSEMVGDGVVDLITSGVINNSKKNINKGKTILGFAFGTTKLFDFISGNPTKSQSRC